MDLIPGVQSTSAALQAERMRMEVISQNIANANLTKSIDGKPYQRQEVVFEAVIDRALSSSRTPGQRVQVSSILTDDKPPRLVYQPGHPDANPDGMVAYPDINIHEEMVDMIAASRAFEANLAVIKTSKNLAMQTLTIGRR